MSNVRVLIFCAELLRSGAGDTLGQPAWVNVWHGLPYKWPVRGRLQFVWQRGRPDQHWRFATVRHWGKTVTWKLLHKICCDCVFDSWVLLRVYILNGWYLLDLLRTVFPWFFFFVWYFCSFDFLLIEQYSLFIHLTVCSQYLRKLQHCKISTEPLILDSVQCSAHCLKRALVEITTFRKAK